jgi:hypothetical protein
LQARVALATTAAAREAQREADVSASVDAGAGPLSARTAPVVSLPAPESEERGFGIAVSVATANAPFIVQTPLPLVKSKSKASLLWPLLAAVVLGGFGVAAMVVVPTLSARTSSAASPGYAARELVGSPVAASVIHPEPALPASAGLGSSAIPNVAAASAPVSSAAPVPSPALIGVPATAVKAGSDPLPAVAENGARSGGGKARASVAPSKAGPRAAVPREPKSVAGKRRYQPNGI